MPRFHLLFDERVELDLARLAGVLAEFDAALERAVVTMDVETRVARVEFGAFDVWFRAVGEPIPEAALDAAVQLAHLDEHEKAAARAHRCFVVIEHAPVEGASPRPLDRFRALAIVTAAFARLGARFIVNLDARTVVPAGALVAAPAAVIPLIERLSPLLFYMGFAKYEVAPSPALPPSPLSPPAASAFAASPLSPPPSPLPAERGEGRPATSPAGTVWMRTHGASAFGLPDLARHTRGHAEGLATFGAMTEVFVHMIESGTTLAVGDVVQLPDGSLAQLRSPRGEEEESFLAGDGPVLVLEPTVIASDP